jgi:phage replication O-like protein O
MLPPKQNYTKVSNLLFDTLVYYMTSHETVVLMTIIRQTHGYNRMLARISINQFMTLTGLTKVTIKKALDELIKYGFITKQGTNRKGTAYELNDTIKIGLLKKRHQAKKAKDTKKMNSIKGIKKPSEELVIDADEVLKIGETQEPEQEPHMKYLTGEWADFIEH